MLLQTNSYAVYKRAGKTKRKITLKDIVRLSELSMCKVVVKAYPSEKIVLQGDLSYFLSKSKDNIAKRYLSKRVRAIDFEKNDNIGVIVIYIKE